MKRIAILTVVIGMAMSGLYAQARVDKKELSDTLTAFCAREASVGKIKITTIRVHNNSVEIFANKQLSTIPWTDSLVNSLYQTVSRMMLGDENGKVRIYCDDKRHEISRLRRGINNPRAEGKEGEEWLKTVKEGREHPLAHNASQPYSIPSGLAGDHIALWGSHGIYFNQKEDRWLWQRAKLLTTVEDLYTTGYTMPFLVPMLENAGAVVIQPRERDTQLHEVIVDEPKSDSWVNVREGGWGKKDILLEGDNPFEMGGYAYSKPSASELLYVPQLPESGEYAVYVSYKTLPSSTTHAKYTVCHRGIETVFTVNQKMGGSMWVYLGTFDFSTDPMKNYVRLDGKSGSSGQVVTADAVRFGGGWGNVARFATPECEDNVPSAKLKQDKKSGRNKKELTGKELQAREQAVVSGYPRWIEGARYWMQYSGVPDTVYNYTESKNDYIDDYASRGQWVNWLVAGQQMPVRLSLAFHTDAGNIKKDSIVGTLAIYTDFDNDKDTVYPNGISRNRARDFADYMQTQIVKDIRAQFAPEWTRRMLHNSSYSEARVPKVPAVLLELLSHQNFADMRYGLDPSFRFTVSRAIYKSMLHFIHEEDGTPYVVQPLPVGSFCAELEENNAVLSWKPVSDELEPTAEPEYFVLYTRIDEGDWDNGQRVDAPRAEVAVDADKRYDFKVVAANAGGISFPSEVLSVFKAPQEKGKVLIVNGFNRVAGPDMLANTDSLAGFQTASFPVAYKKDVCYIGGEYDFVKANPWTSDDDQGYGACYADKAKETEAGNTFDYPVMHGQVLQKLGYSYCSCAASVVDSTMLAKYDVVDLIMGKQKETTLGVQMVQTDYKTFTPQLQDALRGYHGNLLCSGAYIGSDMRSAEDKAFTKEVLHYEYRTHHATRSGVIKGFREVQKGLDGLNGELVMDQNPDILPVENPDAIRSAGDKARVVARYDDSGLGACVAYEGGYKQLIFCFPLESVKNFADLYTTAINWLTKHE